MDYTQREILLVDDDRELCELLAEFLESEGFTVRAVYSGEEAIAELHAHPSAHYAAMVLDIMMPKISGLDVLQRVRDDVDLPIIMLTGRGDDIDRIVGLELGADDYLGKPCNPRELSARLKAVLRRTSRSESSSADRLSLHGITIDLGSMSVMVNGNSISLTGAELKVLHLLMLSAGTVLSKSHMTEMVLQRKLTAYDRSIDVHVSRVRQKLSHQGQVTDVIKSIRGVGYQMIKEGG